MTEGPVFSPKLSLFKARLKAAIIVERAEFNANLERYQHLTQRIVARHGGSGLAPTVEEFQAWCEGVELTRQMKIPTQNIFQTWHNGFMCSHFEALRAFEDYKKFFDVLQPAPSQGKLDTWPRHTGTFIRKPPESDPHDEAVPGKEALLGRWCLVPWRLKPDPENIKKAMARSTFNTRIEGIEKNFTFGPAWQRGQRCIVPADAFQEPDWRTGKAVATRFTRADGQPVGIAGLWDVWTKPGKPPLLSFTMLTRNGADHTLLRDYHRPDDEKRIIVILPGSQYSAWLNAPASETREFIRHQPADKLVAAPMAPKVKAPTLL